MNSTQLLFLHVQAINSTQLFFLPDEGMNSTQLLSHCSHYTEFSLEEKLCLQLEATPFLHLDYSSCLLVHG
jgi:hypothetical protein